MRWRQISAPHPRPRFAFLIILLSVLLSQTFAIINIASTLYRHSNELEQFERYEKYTSSIEFKDLTEKWNNCVNAVSISSTRLGCREQIRDELMKYSSFMNHPLVAAIAREEDLNRKGFYLPDCEYSLDFSQTTAAASKFIDENHSNYFLFTIRARNCRSEKKPEGKEALQKFRGGASFEIHASNVFHIVSCEVRDMFDDSYEVYCPLSKTLNNHHNSHLSDSLQVKVANHHMHSQDVTSSEHHSQKAPAAAPCSCFALSIVLDFEHFDAFSELFYQRPHLNHIILDDDNVCLCNNGTATISEQGNNGKSGSHVKTLISDETSRGPVSPNEKSEHDSPDNILNRNTHASAWVRRVGEPKSQQGDNLLSAKSEQTGLYSGTKTLFAKNHSVNCDDEAWGDFDYSWTGSGNTFPMKDLFLAYFTDKTKQVSTLIGESHFRYTWDYYFYLYYGGGMLSSFSRKHTGTSSDIPALFFSQSLFSTDTADVLYSQACNQDKPGQESLPAKVLAVQTASWDLWVTPLRIVIRNSNAMPHFIKSIKDWAGNNCSSDLTRNRLIYVTTQPVPRCSKDIVNCEAGRGYRNNYAIAALDQWVLRNLLPTKSDLIHFVDASKIIMPKIRFSSSACGNHFLCHESGNIMSYSSGGVALAGEILRCMMLNAPGHIDNINCMSMAQLTSSVEEMKHIVARERRHQSHAPIQYSKIGNGTTAEFYKIEGNIARPISDKYTYELMRRTTHYNLNSKLTFIDFDGDDKKMLSNHPLMASPPIPSRVAGKKYKANLPFVNLPAYELDNEGRRRKLSASEAESADVIEIRNDDLIDMPLVHGCSNII